MNTAREIQIAQEIRNLTDNIRAAFVARMHFLKENKRNTKKFLESCRHDHKTMVRQLHTDLGTVRVDLSDTVEGLRRKFRRQQAGVHKECRLAHSAFRNMQEEMQKCRAHPYTERGEGKSRRH